MTPLLVDVTRVQEFGIIDKNVDVKLINDTIIMVQDIWLQQLLGTDLYQQICTQVTSSTVSALNAVLLNDYIEAFLRTATIAEGIVTFNYRISNKSVVTSDSETQRPVGTSELQRIESQWRVRAEFFAKRLSDYLIDKSNDYPLYLNGNSDSYKIKPSAQNYTSNIFLGNTRRKSTGLQTICRCGNTYRYCTCNG